MPAVLKIASAARIPVTPQAARTSLSGGALCVHGGSRSRWSGWCGSRTSTRGISSASSSQGDHADAAGGGRAAGAFYGPIRRAAVVHDRGNIAHNAGAARAQRGHKGLGHGAGGGDPVGEIIRTGGKLMKNVAGYNLTQLLVGSEGTLAVVTEATLKLLPKPAFARTLLAPFGDVVSAARAVTEIFKARIVPCACEYMERAAVEAAERRKGVKLPVSGEAVLLIEVDGNDESLLERDAERIAEICLAAGAPDVFPADDAEKRRFVWDLRRSIGEAVKAMSAYKEEDTVVPRMRLPDLVQAVREITKKHGLTAVSYGHVGDGNLHVNILRGDLGDEAWRRGIEPAVRELFERTVAMGGQITGEHGVGYVQKNYLGIAYPPHYIELLRSVKKIFDPLGILNPGKILPDV